MGKIKQEFHFLMHFCIDDVIRLRLAVTPAGLGFFPSRIGGLMIHVCGLLTSYDYMVTPT